MFWAALFILGYVLVSVGSGVILYHPVKTIMATELASGHADIREDEIWASLIVTTGCAALWPIGLPLYLASRAAANAVS